MTVKIVRTTQIKPGSPDFQTWLDAQDPAVMLAKYPECAGKTFQEVLDEHRAAIDAQPGFISSTREDTATTYSTTILFENQEAVDAVKNATAENTSHGEPIVRNGQSIKDSNGNQLYYTPGRWVYTCFVTTVSAGESLTTEEY